MKNYTKELFKEIPGLIFVNLINQEGDSLYFEKLSSVSDINFSKSLSSKFVQNISNECIRSLSFYQLETDKRKEISSIQFYVQDNVHLVFYHKSGIYTHLILDKGSSNLGLVDLIYKQKREILDKVDYESLAKSKKLIQDDGKTMSFNNFFFNN